ncbi:MAG: hypothetical protein OEX81_02165 [Candidatus Pacebacteria bacterium]|nr:hypothetical protein [Candidatus Paceibacterota bacterium]
MKNKLWGLLIGLVLTVFFTFPLLNKFSTHLTSRQDGVLISWLINWGSQSLISGQNFFNPPFFHPYQNTIGYSDLFFSTALLNLPLVLIEKTTSSLIDNQTILNRNYLQWLIINHNFHLFIGSLFVFWGQYLLGHYLFKSKKVATLSAVIFAFSSMHFAYIVHLQSFLIAGIPFFFLFLLKFINTQKLKYLTLTSLAALYQILNSPMSGLFIVMMSLVSLFNKKIRLTLWKNKFIISTYTLGIGLLTSFFYLPYFKVSSQFNYTRTIRDSAHFAHSLNIFFTTEMLFYITLLVILFFINIKTNKNNKSANKKRILPEYFWLFISFTILGATLMLGPVIKVSGETFKIFNLPLPLPYLFFYYIVPGFKAFRASSRWIVIFAFGLSLTIGYLVNNVGLNQKNKNIFINLLIVLTTFLLWFTQVPSLELLAVNTKLPPIYQIIKNRPERILAEFPTYVWSQYDDYYKEADRLLYQSYHQKNLYNGFSGFAPPERETLWHTISNNLDDKEVVKHLKDSKVELVLLKGSENSSYKNFSSQYYQLIECIDQDCLYYLR